MQDYTYVVMSNPLPGRDKEYNDWYTNQHLKDVMAVPGFVSARRFRLADPSAADAPKQRYLALYNMRCDNPQKTIETLTQLVESGKMHITEAMNLEETSTVLYEAICPEVMA